MTDQPADQQEQPCLECGGEGCVECWAFDAWLAEAVESALAENWWDSSDAVEWHAHLRRALREIRRLQEAVKLGISELKNRHERMAEMGSEIDRLQEGWEACRVVAESQAKAVFSGEQKLRRLQAENASLRKQLATMRTRIDHADIHPIDRTWILRHQPVKTEG